MAVAMHSFELSKLKTTLALLAEAPESDQDVDQEENCRICLLGLKDETREWIRMDCLCKGDLANSHVDCAIRWFKIRGNNFCDICGTSVSNPEIFIFHQDPQAARRDEARQEEQLHEDSDDDYEPLDSSWSKIATLIVASTIEYFKQKLQDLAEFP